MRNIEESPKIIYFFLFMLFFTCNPCIGMHCSAVQVLIDFLLVTTLLINPLCNAKKTTCPTVCLLFGIVENSGETNEMINFHREIGVSCIM